MRRLHGAAVVLVLLVVAGCGPDEPEPTPLPPVVPLPPAQLPQDRDPGAVREGLERLDACALLARSVHGRTSKADKAECSVTRADGVVVELALGVEFGRGERYRSLLDEVAGAKAYTEESDGCRVAVPVSFTTAVVVSARRGAAEVCSAVAAGVVPELGGLAYRPDEPDQALIGACIDYPYPAECRPGDSGTVPSDADSILATAETDAWSACALVGNAVRDRIGAGFRPVVTATPGARPGCSFVEADHRVVLDVLVDSRAQLPEGNTLTLAGRKGVEISSAAFRKVCVLPVDATERGILCLAGTFLPGRGNNAEPDASAQDQVEPAVVDVVAQHFR